MVHADLSARNFLVTDDWNIQICDFGGSGVQDLSYIAEEEDHYRVFSGTPRLIQTDVFALGCLVYEIAVGRKPYEEIGEDDWGRPAVPTRLGSSPAWRAEMSKHHSQMLDVSIMLHEVFSWLFRLGTFFGPLPISSHYSGSIVRVNTLHGTLCIQCIQGRVE